VIILTKFTDGWIVDSYGKWVTVCTKCVKKHSFPRPALSPHRGNDICDVEDCYNKADYYLDGGK
jgi:hypothetical protein